MKAYQPIDCNFYDLLEIAAMHKRRATIVYQSADGKAPITVQARIADLWARNGEEFMQLDSGETFRLDRLLSLDGVAVPESDGTCRIA